MKKIEKNIFKLSVEEDEKIIFESLMDSFFNALANFVFDKKMNKGIEIVHKFDNAHFEDSKLPPNIKIIRYGALSTIAGTFDSITRW